MCCAQCVKNNNCACSVKSIVSDYKDITGIIYINRPEHKNGKI